MDHLLHYTLLIRAKTGGERCIKCRLLLLHFHKSTAEELVWLDLIKRGFEETFLP